MNGVNPVKRFAGAVINSVSFRLAVICLLVLLLMIPAALVRSLIRERENRGEEVRRETSSKWAGEQVIAGPVLSIPYKQYFRDKDGNTDFTIAYAHFLPDTLAVNSEIFSEIRYRGIYEAVLYNTELELTGSFSLPDPGALNIPPEHVLWSGARLSLGISDPRGIKERISVSFDNTPLAVTPGLETADLFGSGITAMVKLGEGVKAYEYRIGLDLNGSQRIGFVPVGKTTTVSMSSPWPDPSFDGSFLPRERTVDKNGFSAEWQVLDLNRNFPQAWRGKRRLDEASFGVKLLIPVDIYRKSMRTAKYALLFIVLTFAAFFLSEVINRLRIHPIQYILVGLAIVLFYSLLISISEYAGFNLAYFISALAVIVLIAGYARSILKSSKLAAMVGGMLAVLYAYIYVLLQLDDYALLMGSLGLLVILGFIMYRTRKIDWYAIRLDRGENRNDLTRNRGNLEN